MDYKLYDNAALKESIDKRTYLDPIVSCTKEGSEYLVNFEVFKGDCFIDEVNNFYHENGRNTIKLITGEKRSDNPKKLFFMYNLLQIR
jgi:hypothetical protein